MIHIHDIKEWKKLLEESRDEIGRIYGDRIKEKLPLWIKLNNAVKKSKEL